VVLAALLGMLSLNAASAMNLPQESSTLSFTVNTTSSYLVTTGGPLTVKFNSVQLDTSSPQAYAFGVVATAAPGFTITRLHWEFGDGSLLDVPYCCPSEVTEVQYHAYQQPGSYTVLVVAYDSGGNSGSATVTVSWFTPVPEYPTVAIPLLGALLSALAVVAYAKNDRPKGSAFF
jgi:PKD repeat protein